MLWCNGCGCLSPNNLFFLYLKCCELELIEAGGTEADLSSYFGVNEPVYLLKIV